MQVILSNRKGYTLSVLIIIIAVVIVLGFSLLLLSTQEFSSAVREQNRIKAYYIAKSGMDSVASWINKTDRTIYEVYNLVENNPLGSKKTTDFGGGQFEIYFSGNQYYPVIYSLGTYPLSGQLTTKRLITQELIKRTFFDSAITIVSGLLEVKSSNPVVDGKITLVNGGQVTPSGWGNPDTDTTPIPEHVSKPYPQSDNIDKFRTTNPAIVDNPDEYYSDYYDDCNILFDLEDQNVLYFDSLSVSGANNDDIWVIDSRENSDSDKILKIYIRNLDFKGTLQTKNDTKVVIYVIDGGQLTYQTGSGEFDAYVYAPYATVDLFANMTGVGSIYALKVNLQSGGSITYNSSAKPIYPEELGLPSMGYRIGRVVAE